MGMTPDRNDDLPRVIPGQLEVEEVIEMAEAEDGPTRASQVARETDKTPEELQREKTRREVHGRIAKRKALKAAGADVPTASPDLYARLEDSTERIKARSTRAFRARQVVRDRLEGNR
jgi:hypothetical protein